MAPLRISRRFLRPRRRAVSGAARARHLRVTADGVQWKKLSD